MTFLAAESPAVDTSRGVFLEPRQAQMHPGHAEHLAQTHGFGAHLPSLARCGISSQALFSLGASGQVLGYLLSGCCLWNLSSGRVETWRLSQRGPHTERPCPGDRNGPQAFQARALGSDLSRMGKDLGRPGLWGPGSDNWWTLSSGLQGPSQLGLGDPRT